MVRDMRQKLIYVRAVCLHVLFNADTVAVRLILANSSLAWAVTLLGLGYGFNGTKYATLLHLGPEWAWGIFFLLHGLGVYWRLFDPRERLAFSILVNTIGFVTWLLVVLSINVQFLGQVGPGVLVQWVICLACGWMLVRTVRGESRLVL